MHDVSLASMNELAIWTVYGWIGWALVLVLQIVAWLVCGLIGRKLFSRLRRIYHLTVISYWLNPRRNSCPTTRNRPAMKCWT